MAAQAPIPPQPPQTSTANPTWWQQHGTTATWITIGVTALIGLANLGTTWHFRNVDFESKASDANIVKVVDDKFKPLSRDVFDDKVGKVGDKIDKLTDKVQTLSERVAGLEGLTKRVSDLEKNSKQQMSLARLMDPRRVLAVIKADIQMAKSQSKVLPVSDLIDYKNAVQALPASVDEYWTTVAAIINYQSLINQLSGNAPDPAKVSRPCGGLTQGSGGDNLIIGAAITNCVVDLDSTHNGLWNITFQNSVIRYHGGSVFLNNVTFVNCAFVLDLPSNTPPAQPAIVYALLNSNQRLVKVSTPS